MRTLFNSFRLLLENMASDLVDAVELMAQEAELCWQIIYDLVMHPLFAMAVVWFVVFLIFNFV